MVEQDTIKLLRECDAGIKMGVSSIEDVMGAVHSSNLRNLLSDCRAQHDKLDGELQSLLDRYGDEGKSPNPIAKGMSKMKTGMKLGLEESDATVADLITDGCNMALARFPENHNNHANLNEAQQGECGDWNLDNHAERISYYKEFLKENPESKESLRWYFGALLQVGRCEEAAEVIDKLEALYKVACAGDADNGDRNTDKLRIEIYRAQLLWAQGRQEEALARFEEITTKYDTEWLAWNCAADAYAKACRYDEAMKCYNRVMEVQTKPRYTDAPMAMAQICEITGDTAGAIEAWKRYIQVLNEDWDTSEGACIDYANKKIKELTGAY